MKRGKFIVLEGGDGAGKTTLLKSLREATLQERLIITREPGGTPYAEAIRHVLLTNKDAKDATAMTQFLLMWGAREDHVCKLIEPKLREGWNVLSDRLDASTFAYQVHGQQGKALTNLFPVLREAVLRDCKPDLYIFLKVSPQIGLARRSKGRGAESNHFDDRDLDFHKRVTNGYLEFLKHVPHIIIDADQDFESVKREFLGCVREITK